MLMNSANPAIKNAYQVQGGIQGLARQLSKLSKQDLKTVLPFVNQLGALGQKMQGQFDYNTPYAQQALSDAFDPMNAAYNYYLGQTKDSVGAQEAAAGLGATPYGAATTGSAVAAFENAWQMQKLQREQLGAQTATALQNEILESQLGGGQMLGEAGSLANQAYSTSGQLLNEAGQLNLGALEGVLKAYGLQGQNLSAAMQGLVGMLNAMRVSESVSGGGGGGGGGSSGGGLGMSFEQGSGQGALGGGV